MERSGPIPDETEAMHNLRATLAWELPAAKPDPFEGLINPPPLLTDAPESNL